MKSIFYKQWMFLAVLALCLVSCHNGEEKDPAADQSKILDHLIFEEICNSGTLKKYPSPKNNGDSVDMPYEYDYYLKITNPTDKTVYLDGMGLAVSALTISESVTLQEGTDCRETHFGASVLMRFPGKTGETKYAIEPGKSVFLAEVAVNHTKKPSDESDYFLWNKNSYDLSKVDFEWGTPEEIEADAEFPENKDVPNLELVFPYERPQMNMLPKRGAIALIKFPADVTNEVLLSDSQDNPYSWSTTYTKLDTGGGHGHGGKELQYLKFPNEWVVDAVQICPEEAVAWRVVSETVDKGFHSYENSPNKDERGLSLHRKHDGIKFVDNNNSGEDFDIIPASLGKKK